MWFASGKPGRPAGLLQGVPNRRKRVIAWQKMKKRFGHLHAIYGTVNEVTIRSLRRKLTAIWKPFQWSCKGCLTVEFVKASSVVSVGAVMRIPSNLSLSGRVVLLQFRTRSGQDA